MKAIVRPACGCRSEDRWECTRRDRVSTYGISCGGIEPCMCECHDADEPLVRPDLPAGEGYRRLMQTETLQEGDQYACKGEWFDTGDPGYKATEIPYRRPTTTDQARGSRAGSNA